MSFTQTGFQYSGGILSINAEYDKLAKLLSGPFLIFILIFLVILIFLTASNCAIYGILSTEDQAKEPKIKKGFAIFMLVINVIGLLVLVVLFIWILLKFNSYKRNIQEGLTKIYNFYKNCTKANIDLQNRTQELTMVTDQLVAKTEEFKIANKKWEAFSNDTNALKKQLDNLLSKNA